MKHTHLVILYVAFTIVSFIELVQSNELEKIELLENVLSNPKVLTTRGFISNVNNYVDVMLENGTNSIEPLKLVNFEDKFEWKIILKTHHGTLQFFDGWLYNFDTMQRSGDVVLTYNPHVLQAKIPITFNNLTFIFDYTADFMGFRPTGDIEGEINDVHVTIYVVFDLKDMQVYVRDLQMQSDCIINLKINEDEMVSWYNNILTKVATNIFKRYFKKVLRANVILVAKDVEREINKNLQNTFG